MSNLQLLSREIQDLQRRIGRLNNERTNIDRTRANCQVKINNLRNIQAGLKNQASPGRLSFSFEPLRPRLYPHCSILLKSGSVAEQ